MPPVRLFLGIPLAAALAAAALFLPSVTRADNNLVGTVGPGFTITLVDSAGRPVQHLDPGDYTILVHDNADVHDFHLSGPGVDQVTDVAGTGDTTWHVTFTDGTYTFICDPHATGMHGSFTVGNAPATTTTATTTAATTTEPAVTTPAPAPKPNPNAPVRLAGTVGPGFTIALRTAAGAPVKKLKAGKVTLVIRDLASIHNFVLQGPGVDRSTGVAAKG